MTDERITELPLQASAEASDVMYIVSGYQGPSELGISNYISVETLSNYLRSVISLYYSGDPNGFVAGYLGQTCWDTENLILWVCNSTGDEFNAAWVAGSDAILGIGGTPNQVMIDNSTPTVPRVLLPNTIIAPGTVQSGTLRLNGNRLEVIETDGSMELVPNGAGLLKLAQVYWPAGQGTLGQVLISDGLGYSYWGDAGPISTAFTPQVTFFSPGDLSVSYSNQVGNYWISGDLCFYELAVSFIPTFTVASGNLIITGILATPAPSSNTSPGAVVISGNISMPPGSLSLGSVMTSQGISFPASGPNFTPASLAIEQFTSDQGCTIRASGFFRIDS